MHLAIRSCQGLGILFIILSLLWTVALGQLIYQLAKSPAAMRADQIYQPRGFEVLPVAKAFDEAKKSV